MDKLFLHWHSQDFLPKTVIVQFKLQLLHILIDKIKNIIIIFNLNALWIPPMLYVLHIQALLTINLQVSKIQTAGNYWIIRFLQ